jgi:hypothetical protein
MHFSSYRLEKEGSEEQDRETFKVKVFILGDERHPLNVKVELTSDHDIFFLFETVVNEDRYKAIQES